MFIVLFIFIIGIPLIKESIENQNYRDECRRRGEKTRTQNLKHAQSSKIKYDLIGKIAEGTVLTRKTVASIL